MHAVQKQIQYAEASSETITASAEVATIPTTQQRRHSSSESRHRNSTISSSSPSSWSSSSASSSSSAIIESHHALNKRIWPAHQYRRVTRQAQINSLLVDLEGDVEGLLEAVEMHLSEFNEINCATALNRISRSVFSKTAKQRSSVTNDGRFLQLVAVTASFLPYCRPQSLANIINALARLGHEPGHSHHYVMTQLWSSEPGDAFITKLMEVTRPQLPSFTIQGLATLVNGLVALGRRPDAEMCYAIEAVAGPLLSTSTAQGIASLLHGLSTSSSFSKDHWKNTHPSPAFISTALHALSTEPRLSQVTSTTLSSTLSSLPPGYAPLKQGLPGLQRLLAHAERTVVPRLKLPHDCALLLQGLGRLEPSIPPPALIHALIEKALGRQSTLLPRTDGRSLALLVTGLCRLPPQFYPTEAHLSRLGNRTLELLPSLSARGLSSIAYGLCRLGYSPFSSSSISIPDPDHYHHPPQQQQHQHHKEKQRINQLNTQESLPVDLWVEALRRRSSSMTPRDLAQVAHVLAEWTPFPPSSSSFSSSSAVAAVTDASIASNSSSSSSRRRTARSPTDKSFDIQPMVEGVMTQITIRAFPLLPSFTPIDLSTLALALAKLQDAGSALSTSSMTEDFIIFFFSTATSLLPSFTSAPLAKLTYSMAKLGWAIEPRRRGLRETGQHDVYEEDEGEEGDLIISPRKAFLTAVYSRVDSLLAMGNNKGRRARITSVDLVQLALGLSRLPAAPGRARANTRTVMAIEELIQAEGGGGGKSSKVRGLRSLVDRLNAVGRARGT